MNYLNHCTLKTILYLLYGKNSLKLFNFKYSDREKVIKDIFSNNISSLFILKNSAITFKEPSIEDITENLYDISPNIKTLEIELLKGNNKKLTDFIYKYISDFKNDKLTSLKDNYCPFDIMTFPQKLYQRLG